MPLLPRMSAVAWRAESKAFSSKVYIALGPPGDIVEAAELSGKKHGVARPGLPTPAHWRRIAADRAAPAGNAQIGASTPCGTHRSSNNTGAGLRSPDCPGRWTDRRSSGIGDPWRSGLLGTAWGGSPRTVSGNGDRSCTAARSGYSAALVPS